MKQINSSFLNGAILPTLLRFSFPVLLALILQALYGAVDLWAVGMFAATADISAVATGSQTMQIITGLVTGLATGATVLLGIYIGRKKPDDAAKVVGSSIFVFTILGVILSIAIVLAAPWLARITNAPPEAFAKTVAYIRICGAGSLFIVAYNLISAIFRGLGDSKSPLYFVIIACVINIMGDIILTKYIPMGAAGTAIATVTAQAVSVILSIILIRRKALPFDFSKAHLQPQSQISGSILKLGTPIAMQSMCNEISYLVILGFVNALGEVASAGVGIAEKIAMFILLIPTAYMQSISAFVAQNEGAGLTERAKKSLWLGMMLSTLLGSIFAYFSIFHGTRLSTLFIKADETAVLLAAAEFLKATSIECFILSAAYCLVGYFNGTKHTNFVMLQSMLSIFVVKLPYAWFASSHATPSIFQIGMAGAFAAAFELLACLWYYNRLKKDDEAPTLQCITP